MRLKKMEDLKDYLLNFVVGHYQDELKEEVLKLLPKLEQEGITTPLQFRDEFNSGSFAYPSFNQFIDKLDKYNGNERAVSFHIEVTEPKLIKQIIKKIQKG